MAKHEKRVKRAKLAAIVPLYLLIAIAIAALFYIWKQLNTNPPTQNVSTQSGGKYYGEAKLQYSNEIFQFESARKWEFNRGTSNIPNKYVYISQRNGLVEYELVIYVDATPKEAVNYIMPTVVSSDGRTLSPSSPSEKCDDKKINVDTVDKVYREVKFICAVHNSGEIAALGVAGGSYGLPMIAGSGSKREIAMFFNDHTSNYRPDEFLAITRSFRLK